MAGPEIVMDCSPRPPAFRLRACLLAVACVAGVAGPLAPPLHAQTLELGIVGGAATSRGLKYADPAVDDELLPIQLQGYWGLLNQRGRIIVLPHLDWTDFGVDGLARANRNGLTGIIRGNGAWAIHPSYEYLDRFEQNYAVFGVGGKYGYLDKTERVRLRPELDGALRFREGRAAVRVGNLCGFIDQRFQLVTPLRFSAARSFHDGLAAVRLAEAPGSSQPPPPAAVEESEAVAGAQVEPEPPAEAPDQGPHGRWAYLNKAGNLAFIDHSASVEALGDFNDGLARFKRDGRWGYLSRNFSVALMPRFEEARDFTRGLAAVKLDGKWGFIDKSFALVIPPTYDDADDFDDTLAMVKLGDKYGYIGRTGRVVIDPQFDDARPFRLGLARVKVGDSFGYVDAAGRILFDPRDARFGIVDVTAQERARRSVRYFDRYNRVLNVPPARPVQPEPYPPDYQYDEQLTAPG